MPIHVREEKTMKDKKESERRAGRGNEGREHRNNGKTEEMRKGDASTAGQTSSWH